MIRFCGAVPDVYLLTSGLLVLGLGVFHSVLGEIYLVRRLLRREDLPRLFGNESFTRLTIRYAWHLPTIFCVASAAVLFFLATTAAPDPRIAMIFGGCFAVCGFWGLVSTRGRHWSWLVLLVAAALAFKGAV